MSAGSLALGRGEEGYGSLRVKLDELERRAALGRRGDHHVRQPHDPCGGAGRLLPLQAVRAYTAARCLTLRLPDSRDYSVAKELKQF